MREIYADLTINKLTLTFEIKVIALIGNIVVIYTQKSTIVPKMNSICKIYRGASQAINWLTDVHMDIQTDVWTDGWD